jgi:hypothetical protein
MLKNNVQVILKRMELQQDMVHKILTIEENKNLCAPYCTLSAYGSKFKAVSAIWFGDRTLNISQFHHPSFPAFRQANLINSSYSSFLPIISPLRQAWFNCSNSFSSASVKVLSDSCVRSGWPASTQAVYQKEATA